jgi:RHS repeat-associated protein
MTSVDGVEYTWDANGNLLSGGLNTYTYDGANRLTSLSNPLTESSYRYNGLGDRLQETVNGGTTTFVMDLNSGLTQALSDGTNTYLYGVDRIAQAGGTGTEYFLGDALGSVRQLADVSGEVVLARAYDPYGVTAYSSGIPQSAYGFTGEYASNGLVYLRARHYSVSMGRFLSRDTWSGDANQPMSYNLWLYVYANPINNIDPSGLHTAKDWGCSRGDPGLNADIVISHVTLPSLSQADEINTYALMGLAVQCWATKIDDAWWRFGQNDSWGPAQVSDRQTENPYGSGDPKNLNAGDNLRCYVDNFTGEVKCFTPYDNVDCQKYSLETPLDQDTWNNAFILMRRRIQHAIDTCPACRDTDKYIIAAMAQNGPGYTGVFKGTKYSVGKLPEKEQTPGYVYDWMTYYKDSLKAHSAWWDFFARERTLTNTVEQLRRFTKAKPAFKQRGWHIPDLDGYYINALISLQ